MVLGREARRSRSIGNHTGDRCRRQDGRRGLPAAGGREEMAGARGLLLLGDALLLGARSCSRLGHAWGGHACIHHRPAEVTRQRRPELRRVVWQAGVIAWQVGQPVEDQLVALRRQNVAADDAAPIASGVDIGALNFRYRIEGDDPAWRPLRAFDDGRQVFIEFPSGIGQGEMPPLWVIGADGGAELVNYRVRGRRRRPGRCRQAARWFPPRSRGRQCG